MGCAYSKTCIGQICATKKNSVRQPHQQAPARGTRAATATAAAATEEENPVFNFSSDAADDEDNDEIHQLSLSRDQEWGITRLSRVSSQFLPPDGSRIVKVPSCNYELKYSFLSQRGYYPDALDKANQDSFAIHTPFGSNSDDHFFGVFDGHGEFGAQCSQFVKRRLCENLLRHGRFRVEAAEACNSAFLSTNSQLHADVVDDSMSGTTAITVMVRGRTIYVANAGDSRAVLAEKREGDLVAVDLSIDQTPFRPDELERVKLCGARVLTLDQIEGLKILMFSVGVLRKTMMETLRDFGFPMECTQELRLRGVLVILLQRQLGLLLTLRLVLLSSHRTILSLWLLVMVSSSSSLAKLWLTW